MRRSTNHARVGRLEVRWFIEGDDALDVSRRWKPVEQRIDCYHLDSLSHGSAWKRRGLDGPFEHKRRLGPPRPVVVHGVAGVAERWSKVRTRRQTSLGGEWLDVAKQVWAVHGAQLTRVGVEHRRVWTLSLRLPDTGTIEDAELELEPWWPLMRRQANASSFPAWLLGLDGVDPSSPCGDRGSSRARVEPSEDRLAGAQS